MDDEWFEAKDADRRQQLNDDDDELDMKHVEADAVPSVDDQLRAEVVQVSRNAIAKKTKDAYAYRQINFVLWLDMTDERRALLSDTFLSRARRVNGVIDRKFIKAELEAGELDKKPLKFELVTEMYVKMYLQSLKKRGGDDVSNSVHQGTRSAVRDLFRRYEHLDLYDKMNLETFSKGLKRNAAVRQGKGQAKIETGKIPLEFSLYCQIATRFLTSGKTEHIFAHLFLILSWNLCCRAGNTAEICFAHLAWQQDALGIIFAHTKSDSTGERKKDYRHLYANPFIPCICPVFTLGLYLLCFPKVLSGTPLFPGHHQYDRFVL